MREQLLGYLLGALEPQEQAQVAKRLLDDAELRRELEILRRGLEPLDDEHPEPPRGLAAKTCSYVADRRGPSAGQFGACSQWRIQDLCVAASLFIAATMLLMPAVYQSRCQANLAACQHNLASLGRALYEFSQIHDGQFPEVPVNGPLAAAGIYAPLLREAGLISDGDVVCPASSLRKSGQFRIPSRQELQETQGMALRQMQGMMGGSYGYCIGYVSKGRYRPRKNLGRENFALVADAPSQWSHDSSSHHGPGHNVLFEDGHVRYVTTCWLIEGADHFFENAMGYVAAGVDADDAVIVPSGTPPMILRTMLGDE